MTEGVTCVYPIHTTKWVFRTMFAEMFGGMPGMV